MTDLRTHAPRSIDVDGEPGPKDATSPGPVAFLTSRTTQRAFVWCGPAFAVALTIGLLVAGWIPPPHPSRSAQQVANAYLHHKYRIRVGVLLMSLGVGLVFPWVVVVFVQLRRIGRHVVPLAYLSLVAGALTAMMFMLPCAFWEVAAYRPERDPQLTQLLNDMAWVPFIGLISFFVVQNVSIAAAIFADRRATPVFPRWSAYFNIWVMILFSPACLDIFFKSGPVAWNGIFAFWLGLGAFGAWYVVMTVLLLRAVGAEPADAESAS